MLKKNDLPFLCCIASFVMFVGIICFNAAKPVGAVFVCPVWCVLLLTFLFVAYFFFAQEFGQREKMLLILFFFFAALAWCAIQPVFSPIDEGAHMAYIHYIAKYNRFPVINEAFMDSEWLASISQRNVPSGVMYEAVHPQLYYFCMALFCKAVVNAKVQLWICRFFGCVFLTMILRVLFLWTEYCYDKKLLKNKKNAMLTIFFLLLLPGILIRFTTVSNEGMAALWLTLFFYHGTKAVMDGVTKQKVLLLALFVVLAAMTKTTTIFIFPILCAILLYHKEYKYMAVACFAIGLAVAPWLIWNYMHYKAFTGMKEHLAFALPIVNPQEVPIPIVPSLFKFFTFFIHAQEGYFPHDSIDEYIVCFLNVFLWLVFLCYSVRTLLGVKALVGKKFSYTDEEKRHVVCFVYFLSMVGNFAILILGAVSSRAPVILGRYFYVSLLPSAYMISCFFEKDRKHSVLIGFAIAVLISALCVDDVIYRTVGPKFGKIINLLQAYF